MSDSQKRLSSVEWAAIVTAYERGEKTIPVLAAEFKVSDEAIRKGLRKRNVVKNSRNEEVIGEAVDEARLARERKVKAAEQAVDQYAKYNDVITKLTIKRVIDGDRDGTLAGKNAEILTLKNAAAIVERCRREQWDIQGLENLLGENAELPDLNVGEYSPDELEAIRAANEDHYQESMRSDDDEDQIEGDDFDEDNELPD
jgi:hypothetical protein